MYDDATLDALAAMGDDIWAGLLTELPREGFSLAGDAIYDGPLLDQLDGSNVADYCTTMERLLDLPVDIVHGGHDPSFGRDRLREIARDYLTSRK
jgi:glyoxylase-like metal-dependent hydrolase (beta-lactamase superfamily II)